MRDVTPVETMSDLMWCKCNICGETFEARYRSLDCPHKDIFFTEDECDSASQQ